LANISADGNEKIQNRLNTSGQLSKAFKNIFTHQDYQEQDKLEDDNAYMQFQDEGYQNPYGGYYGG